MKRVILIVFLIIFSIALVSCIEVYLPEPVSETPVPKESAEPTASPEPPPPTPDPDPTSTATPTPTPLDLTTIKPGSYNALTPEADSRFSDVDWRLDGIAYHAAKSVVAGRFGAPASSHSEVWGATGETHEYYEYAWGEVEFVEGLLAGAEIYTDAVSGPRGITVGDQVDDVIKMFCTSYEKQDNEMLIFYRNNPHRDNWLLLPPYGVMTNYTKLMLSYAWYDIGEYDMHETLDTLESDTPYLDKLSFSMYINGQGIVKEIYLKSGADAE